jgi:predicted dehydrogenase
MHRTHLVECLVGAKYVEQHLSPDRTRAHRVHLNTISPAFDRGSLGQAKYSVFAGHVGAHHLDLLIDLSAPQSSRQETADETAKHFGIPHAFADPYEMVQHPDVDLVAICVRVPSHHPLGMAALNAGKHLYCEWPLAATTEQAQQMRDLAVRKGVHQMVGLQARGACEFNRVRDLVAEGYVCKVLSCTMIITTPAWGTEFTRDWAYMADRSNGNTLMTSPGGHSIDALCFCLGEFKELSNVVANQRQRVTIVETGETIQMTAPDQVLLSGVLQSGAVASVHLRGGIANGTGFLFEIHGTEADLAIVPADSRQATYIQVSEFTVRGGQAGKPLADLSIPESYRWVPPEVPAGLPFNLRSCTCGWLKAFAKEGASAQTSMWRQTPPVA